MTDEMDANLLAETENYMVWTSDVEGDTVVHLELGGLSLHLDDEEWNELATLIKIAMEK